MGGVFVIIKKSVYCVFSSMTMLQKGMNVVCGSLYSSKYSVFWLSIIHRKLDTLGWCGLARLKQ